METINHEIMLRANRALPVNVAATVILDEHPTTICQVLYYLVPSNKPFGTITPNLITKVLRLGEPIQMSLNLPTNVLAE